MKKVLEALATYNKNVDLSVLEILEPLGDDKALAKTKAFFPTVVDGLVHILSSDINWLKRISLALPDNPVLKASRIQALDIEAVKREVAADRRAVYGYIREADVVLLSFVAGLSEADLELVLSYTNYKGQSESHELWKILLQWLNHATHHRGSISAQLDELGVQNDYSSLMARI